MVGCVPVHIMDKVWGHVVVRMCGYPSFGAQVILNGHEWVDLKAGGLKRDDNVGCRTCRRYEVPPESIGLLCGMATLHDRVLVPILTIMSRGQKPGTLQPDPHPINQHYEQIRQVSVEIMRHLGVAA